MQPAEVDIIEEQQLKQMQSGSSSWSGHNWGVAAEEDTVGEQQLKQMQLGSNRWNGQKWAG